MDGVPSHYGTDIMEYTNIYIYIKRISSMGP